MTSPSSDLRRAGDHSAIERSEATDFVLALTIGPNAWVTPDSASTPMVNAGLALALTGYLTMATVTVSEVLYQDHGRSAAQQIVMCWFAILAMAMLASSAMAAFRRQRHRGGQRSMLLWRVGALLIFSIIWITTVPAGLSLLVWPIGLSAGAEAALTAQLIGHDRTMGSLYANYLQSPLHLGAAVAAVTCALAAGNAVVDRLVITGIFSLETAAVASVLAYGALRQMFEREHSHVHATRLVERAEEFRRRAHWIHDDVCSDLRELRVKMASHTLNHEQISRELDLFDDRLRERQLDEMLNGGAISAAEILQSYVRRAQNAGVRIIDVPRFEEASVLLGAKTALILRRCTAGFVSNALAAGARTLSIQLSSLHGDLILAVTDDAGGFDLADAPSGRGLSSLAHDLGSDRLTSARSVAGTTIMARIPLDGDS